MKRFSLFLLFVVSLGLLVEKSPAQDQDPEEQETRSYRVRPNFWKMWNGSQPSDVDDPFASPADDAKPRLVGRDFEKDFFEAYGVEFPEGSFARFDADSRRLEIRQTRPGFELVEAVFESIENSAERKLNIRVEIFEMPAKAALKVQQLTGPLNDHTPIYRHVIDMVDREQARLVNSVGTLARSGNRMGVKDASELIYATEVEWDGDEGVVIPRSFETREVGTLLEVDPLLGADGYTIDLNFQLEHHTAPPIMREVTVTSPATGKAVVVEMPEFHAKQIVSQIAMEADSMKCVGAWRPTGKPEFEEADLMQVVFLRIDEEEVKWFEPWTD